MRPTASSSPEAIAVSMQPFTDEVTLFCRNTRNLRLQTTRTVSEERALLSLSVTTAAVIAGSTSQTAFTTVSVLETIADDSNDEDQMQVSTPTSVLFLACSCEYFHLLPFFTRASCDFADPDRVLLGSARCRCVASSTATSEDSWIHRFIGIQVMLILTVIIP